MNAGIAEAKPRDEHEQEIGHPIVAMESFVQDEVGECHGGSGDAETEEGVQAESRAEEQCDDDESDGIVGKLIGIFAFGGVSGKLLGLPGDMSYKDLLVLASCAGIGFTVALFVAGVAFPDDGDTKDAAKLGALLSLGSMFVAFALSKICDTERHA